MASETVSTLVSRFLYILRSYSVHLLIAINLSGDEEDGIFDSGEDSVVYNQTLQKLISPKPCRLVLHFDDQIGKEFFKPNPV